MRRRGRGQQGGQRRQRGQRRLTLQLALPQLAFTNPQVQRLRKLLSRADERRSEGRFVIEGATLLTDALGAGAAVESVFVDTARIGDSEQALLAEAAAQGAAVHEVRPGVIDRVASTVTPQPLAAVVPIVDVPIDRLPTGGCVLVCVGLSDPGNLGTILRSAAASGSRAVVCCGGSVDPYNPKCVRASAGALLRVPLVVGGEPIPILEELRGRGWECFAAMAHGGTAHVDANLSDSPALVFGNEAKGLPSAVEAVADATVTVELAPGAESLNVAMAATVLAFEARRQRLVRGDRR